MAGVSRQQYANEIRLIRVMCSGRVDLGCILHAFLKGADGVLIAGCRLGDCNYTTHGNFDALANVSICRKIMSRLGLKPERLQIEFLSGGDSHILVAAIDSFTETIKELGPLGSEEDMNEKQLRLKFTAAVKLVPYLKLVERKKFRREEKSETEYRGFYSGDGFDRLYKTLIDTKLTLSQILLLLEEKPRPAVEIAKALNLDPSLVIKIMNASAQQGMVWYDTDSQCFIRT